MEELRISPEAINHIEKRIEGLEEGAAELEKSFAGLASDL